MTWLHRCAVLLAVSTGVLLLLGASVTSSGAGLAVVTWPATFGDGALSNAALQQAHRVVAAVVGVFALVVAIGVWRIDRRPWMNGLALGGLALVVAQAVYGGIGVLNGLPSYFAVLHAVLAEAFLGITVALAVFTSRAWLEDAHVAGEADRRLRRYAVAATAAICLEIVLGAAMRHNFLPDGRPAGFAIPDYPLAFGRLLPLDRLGSWASGLDFFHRLTAVATAALVALSAARVFRRHLDDDHLVWPAALLALVLLAQIALGGLTVLSGGHPAVSTAHASAVAVALAASLILSLWSYRSGRDAVPAAAAAAPGGKGPNA